MTCSIPLDRILEYERTLRYICPFSGFTNSCLILLHKLHHGCNANVTIWSQQIWRTIKAKISILILVSLSLFSGELLLSLSCYLRYSVTLTLVQLQLKYNTTIQVIKFPDSSCLETLCWIRKYDQTSRYCKIMFWLL